MQLTGKTLSGQINVYTLFLVWRDYLCAENLLGLFCVSLLTRHFVPGHAFDPCIFLECFPQTVAFVFGFLFFVFHWHARDAMRKHQFLLYSPCSDVYMEGKSALMFFDMYFCTVCWESTKIGRGKPLCEIQTQGFFEQVFYVFVLLKYWCIFW